MLVSTIRITEYYTRFSLRFAEWTALRPSWKQVRVPLISALGGFLVLGVVAFLMRQFRVGLSLTDSSSAEGFYRLADAPIRHGALVAACLPAGAEQEGLARRYLVRGDCPWGAEPVLKIAAGLPGDRVEVEPKWVAINGVRLKNSATVARDSAGRALGHVPWGSREVEAGEAWLFGFNNRRSWDSRYFGPVPLRAIGGVAEPVLTW